MKKLIKYCLLGLVSCLSFSSCISTTYFYSTIDTIDDTIQLNEKGEFIYNDDTVSVVYNFSGYDDIPFNISVYNKLEEPLFLDWTESSLIVDEESINLASTITDYEGEINTYTDSFSGSATKMPNTMFIPPKSWAKATPVILTGLVVTEIPDEELESMSIVDKTLKMTPVKLKQYTLKDSPLYFQSYLTFYTSNETRDQKTYFSVLQNFYISEVLKTNKMSPNEINSNYRGKGNVAHSTLFKENRMNILLSSTLIVVGVAVLVSLLDFPAENVDPAPW